MLSLGTIGMLLMMVNGMLGAFMVISGKVLQELEWPFFRLMGVSSTTIVLCLGALILRSGLPMPDRNQAKWLMFRGGFGAATFLLQVSAVRIGVSPGDAAALASVNTILAALLGRMFLGEKLAWAQGVGVFCSLSGAVLISKPSFLFNSSATDSSASGIGYLLAAASGMTQACVYISARKSKKSSLLFLNISPAICCALVFPLTSLMPIVEDFSMDQVARSPLAALALIGAFFLIQFGAMTTNSVASTLCPAAVSATVNTGSKMVLSYVAQTVLFGKTPDSITLCGAALMLGAVIVMAVARLPERQTPVVGVRQVAVQEGVSTCDVGFDDDNGDNESLASFIAAEFVEYMPHDKPVRLTAPVRRPGAQEPTPLPIGAVLSAIVIVA